MDIRSAMSEEKHWANTAAISEKSLVMRRLLNRDLPASGTTSLNRKRQVTLFVRGIAERVVLSENSAALLGRFDLSPDQRIDIDLTAYGAVEHGVSRVHARLDLVNGKNVYITDLGSTNGTVVGGTRLQPYQPHLLRNMDQVLLGGLPMKILLV